MTRPKRDATVPLDTSLVETRMAALGLKQYWLAEQLGVHPRTVLRWVNGQVRRIQREHLGRLAHHLQCREDELSSPEAEAEEPEQAEMDPRAEAARRLIDDDILALLTPSGSMPMVETLIAATLDGAITPHTRGKLLVMLSVAVGRQFRCADAIAHARAAEAIGRQLGNRVIVAQAGYAEAWARLYAGEIAAAHALFQRAVDELDFLGEPTDAAMAWFGLGSCQGFEGDHEAGLRSLGEAIARLDPNERPVDASLPLYVRGVMLTDVGRYDEAAEDLERSRALAASVGWKAGIGRATAAAADVLARRGAIAEAVARYAEALACFADEGFVHPAVFIAGASVFRRAGDLTRARAEVERGLAMAEKFRPEREALLRLRREIEEDVTMATYRLQTDAPRPDFRLIIAFLWSDDHNVDTDGDAKNPASRAWTEFDCRDRARESDRFTVDFFNDEQPQIIVKSRNEKLAARVTLFLSAELGVESSLSTAELTSLCGDDFDVEAAFERARQSRFRRATEAQPYP